MVGCGEVVHKLNFMGGDELFDGFDFQNNSLTHQNVDRKDADIESFIKDFDGDFAFKGQIGLLQFVGEGVAVNGFEESMSQGAVNLHCAANNQMG